MAEEKNVENKSGQNGNYEIHVMPQKFIIQKPVKSNKWLIILLIVIIVIIGLSLGAYYLSQQLQKPNLNQAPVANLNANINEANENLNANGNLNENINANLNENGNANVQLNANGALNVNSNTNTTLLNTNEASNTNAIEIPSILEGSIDSDKDGLTDNEEELYTTELKMPDTDGDGYLDGQEVKDGYNPKVAGNSKLADSGLVNTYPNDVFKYKILYPASWLAKPTDASLRSVVFQSATGEYIQVMVEDNQGSGSVMEWFLKQSPTSDPNRLKSFTSRSGLSGVISEDGLTYYLADPNDLSKIYILTYNIGTKTELSYLTTFEMMIGSLKVGQ